MPPVSQQQRKLMWATRNGADTGVPMNVAEEFTDADPGGKLPKRASSRNKIKHSLKRAAKHHATRRSD